MRILFCAVFMPFIALAVNPVFAAQPVEDAFPAELAAGDYARLAHALEKTGKQTSMGVVLPAPEWGETKGASDVPPTGGPLNAFIPFLGPEIEKVSIIKGGVKVDKFWQELSREEWTQAMSSDFNQIVLYDLNKEGDLSLSYSGAEGSLKLGKGKYRLRYHNIIYKPYVCSPENPNAGYLYVGVGLRITADVKTNKKGLSIGLGPLALSTSRNEISGTISAETVGLSGSSTLRQVVGELSKGLSYDTLIKATNALAVANQILEDKISFSSPRVFGYVDYNTSGACLAAAKAYGMSL